MTSWQKRARVGVLVFGVAVAGIVYLAMGERVRPVNAEPVERIDPKAMVETAAGFVERVKGTEREFEVTFARSLRYDDDTTRMFKIRIVPPVKDGRQFVVNANEGHSGKQQRVIQLAGDVKVEASDGFTMTTEAGAFNQDDSIAKAPGAVEFGRGRMSGAGRDVSYDTHKDVLVILSEPHVVTTTEDGGTMMEFTAGSATLDRAQHLLTLDGTVHILRGTQTFDSDRAVAFLNDANDVVRRIEMRGNSRVGGESKGVAGMSARDIDLDYTDDGGTLETAALQGTAALTMTGQNGAAGRQMSGDRLELTLDPEGYLTKAAGIGAAGANRVTLSLPADEGVPARTIKARHLDATGLPGKGLNAIEFTDEVEFREQAAKAGATDRVVTAGSLKTSMADDKVTGAYFGRRALFEERGLVATAVNVDYLPEPGTLTLRNADAKGKPQIKDDRMQTDAGEIEITLNPRRVKAKSGVATTLRPPAGNPPGGQAAAGSRLPGVFKQDQAANVYADGLDYSADTGQTVYTRGTDRATLRQGDNSVSGDRLELNQDNGDLVAAGNATSRLTLASGVSQGAGREIRLDNEQRTIRYTSALAAPAAPPARGRRGTAATAPTRGTASGAAAPAVAMTPATTPAAVTLPLPGPPLASLNGGEGDLRGETITVSLAASENRVEQVEVTSTVSVVFDSSRSATGDRLVYSAASEKYELTGTMAAPAKFVDRKPPSCKESSGRSLTYDKRAGTILNQGEGDSRVSFSTKPCATTPAR